MPLPPIDLRGVFLNIPYDVEFRSLYVAYVVGICHLGFVPHIASEIPGGERRLERILALIKSCRYSIHDLSRVELGPSPHATPRFNMPLELGLAITWSDMHPELHAYFVFESELYRIQRSTSDLNGTDASIHHGTAEGVLSELRSAFWRDDAPTVPQMLEVHGFIDGNLNAILTRNATQNPYAPSVFRELRWVSTRVSELLHPRRGH
ncbi:MAG TPA: hypothetical protein VMD29_07775 [Terracidiphilus sp.]|jgi:hypothetical protein|nr:hypothetical protein [Terracidiphilus sp.]